MTTAPILDPALRAALDAADQGQRARAFEALGALNTDDPAVTSAAQWAVTSRLWLTNPTELSPPEHANIAPFTATSEPAREIASLACSASALGSVLRLNRHELAQWNELNRALLGANDGGVAGCWLQVSRAWEAAAAGRGSQELDTPLEALRSQAVEAGAALLVVEAAALRALVALNDGDVSEATERARRASRMARTEGIPRAEFLAHLVLARMRRISGKPHLAARILSSLLEFAGAPWHPWMLWELRIAGGDPGAVNAGLAPAWALAADVAELLAAAEAGHRERFDAALARAEAEAAPFSWLAADVRILAQLVDPETELDSLLPTVQTWVRGETDETPYGLHGLCASPSVPDSEEAAVAFVLAGPGKTPRRVLLQGLELAADGGERVAQMRRRSGRLDTAAAALALAGPDGLESTEFFRAVYGFGYTPEIHRGVIKTLVHRLRARLEDLARIHSEAGRLSFDPLAPMILPDPRCAAALNDRVLWLLSTHRGMSAREAAQRLGLPLRTVQTALHELVEDGSCESLRSGRSVSYEVEDTTFSEPTQILRRRGKA